MSLGKMQTGNKTAKFFKDYLLIYFEFRKNIKIMADAFNVAVGGVLLELENEWRPISSWIQIVKIPTVKQ